MLQRERERAMGVCGGAEMQGGDVREESVREPEEDGKSDFQLKEEEGKAGSEEEEANRAVDLAD